MKVLEFKNGNKIKVDDYVADIISQRTLSPEGAKVWQIFSKESDNKNPFLIINLGEVAGIYSNENII